MASPPLPIDLAIELQPSFIATHKFVEYVCPHALQQLIDSDFIKAKWDTANYSQKMASQLYLNEKEQLKAYQLLYNKKAKAFLVRYAKAKHKWGRNFPVKSLGLTSFSKKTRNTLIRFLYYDFDLSNAQPEIVRNLCRRQGIPIPCEIIDKYCNEREAIIEQIINASGGKADRDAVKSLMIRLSFFGGFAGWLKDNNIPDFPEPLIVQQYRQQINIIANLFIEKNPDMFKTIKRIKQEKGEENITGAFFSTYLQEFETRIVEKVLAHLCDTTNLCYMENIPQGAYNAVYEYDGIKLWQANVDNFRIYDDGEIIWQGLEGALGLMNHLLKCDGWDMKFEIKPITKFYDIVFMPPPPLLIIDRKELKEQERALKERERKQAKDDLFAERADLISDKTNLLAQTDLEASEIIYSQLKDRVKYVNEVFYYKNGWYWIEKYEEVKCAMRVYVLNSGIKRLNEFNQVIPFTQNKKCADAVASVVLDKCMINNRDDNWAKEMYKSSLGKILFNNGYYDFHKGRFFTFKNKDYNHSIVFINRIDYDYVIPKTAMHKGVELTFDDYKADIKQRLFITPFCEKRANYYILTLARGLAGDVIKRFFMCIGEGDSGKSTITTALDSVCGGYFGTFNGNNICCKKFANPDVAQARRWIMLLRGKRIIASNEISTDELIDGEIMKMLSSGGRDKIVARGHQGNETEFHISFLPIVYANDIEKIKPFDSAIETRLRTLVYEKVYKDNPSNEFELKKDTGLDAEILTDNFRFAFLALLIDSYTEFAKERNDLEDTVKTQLKEAIQDVFEDAADISIADRIATGFAITNKLDDFETNVVIEDWLKRHKIGMTISKFTRALKRYAIINKLADVKNDRKDGRRGWRGISKLETA
jgi:phage/plasmid-associated DNA primase